MPDEALGADTEQETEQIRRDLGPRDVGIAIALSIISAGLNVVAHPPYRAGVLALVAYVPMIVAQHRFFPRRLAGIALAIGIAGPAWWGITTVIPQRAVPAMRLFPLVLAILLVVIGAVDRSLMEATRYRYFVFAVPLVWTALSLGLSYGPTGTIGTGAHALHPYPALIQPVSVVGALGLVLVIYLANWALAAVALSLLKHPDFRPRRSMRIIATTACVGVAWVVTSLLLFDDPASTVTVAAVQPGPRFDAGTVIGANPPAAFEQATRDAARRGAELVVWPEGALAVDDGGLNTAALRDLAQETRTHLAVGYAAFEPGRMRNEAVLVTPEGRVLGPYAKQHPVRFLGERSDTDYGYPVFSTPLGRTALLICFDLDFMDTPRRMARQGAGLIAVPSNDWSEIADVHYAGFVLRAIENRVTLVKADVAWDSAIIDPYGRVKEKLVDAGGRSGVIIASVPVGSGRTIASKVGDLNAIPIALAAVAVLIALVRGARRDRGRRRERQDLEVPQPL